MRKLRTATLTAMATVLVSLPTTASASAGQPLPFTDSNSDGAITFCGRNGQEVTSGSVLEQPFVWKAISSSPAPARYTRAYLLVYQPIQNVDPGDWTGYTMTNVAIFSSAAHPAVQSTNIDLPLLEPDRQIPPVWDGLYEVRMFFTGLGQPVYNSTYPTAVIRVTGNSWQMVSGGGTPCSSGQAVSATSRIANPRALATPQTIRVGSAPGTGTAASQAVGDTPGTSPSTTEAVAKGPGSATTTATTARASTAREAALPAQVASRSGHSSGTSAGLITAIAALVAAAAAATVIVLRRRGHKVP